MGKEKNTGIGFFLPLLALAVVVTVGGVLVYGNLPKSPGHGFGGRQDKLLTKQEVTDFLAELKKACNRRDLSFFRDHLALDAKITLDQAGRTVRFNTASYLMNMTKIYDQVNDYSYDQTDPIISLNLNRAMLRFTATETAQLMGNAVKSETKTIMEIAKRHDRIFIERISGDVTSKME